MPNEIVENALWVAPLLLALALWLAFTAPHKCARRIFWALTVAGVWVTIWAAIRYVVTDSPDAPTITWVARSVLRGLYALSDVIFSAWFIPALVLVLIFRTELAELIARIAKHAKSLEAGGVKIELAALESAPITVSARWWADRPAAGEHTTDTPAGDGAMRVRPERPTKQYSEAVDEIERLLSTVTTKNQFQVGPGAKRREDKWVGEYTEYLELTLNVLRQRVREGMLEKVDEEYLATSFTTRHIMLYINGDNDHAFQFLADLPRLNEDHARGTLVRSMGYWFLLFLCERKHFNIAREVVNHRLLSTDQAASAAHKALFYLKTARYAEAIETAAAGLKVVPETVPDKEVHQRDAAKVVLQYVLAQAYLRTDNPTCAIKYAEMVVNHQVKKARGLIGYLKGCARRTFASACVQSRKTERLQSLIENDVNAAEDAYVVHALSVALADEGSRTLALEAAKRAYVLLPGAGEDALRKAVESNMAALQDG